MNTFENNRGGKLLICLCVGTMMMLALGCGAADEEPAEDEDAWWKATGEPNYDGKGDENVPLTIFFSKDQVDIEKVLNEDVGEVGAGGSGMLNVDGFSISDRTHLIIKGEVHRFDGQIDEHLLMVKPTYWSHEQGAANHDGFLAASLSDSDNIRVGYARGDRFGTATGVFRGEIVATDELTLADEIPDDLVDLMIRPDKLGQRPSNFLGDVEIIITPVASLSRLEPAGGCQGDSVIDKTLVGEELTTQVALSGFPAGEDVEVEVQYSLPHRAAESRIGKAWAWVQDSFSENGTDEIVTETITADTNGLILVDLPTHTTRDSALGSDLYTMNITVKARSPLSSGPWAPAYEHQLVVSEPDAEVIVDQFELCPLDDALCHQFRDEQAPDNVVARRAVIEFKADREGLYDVARRELGRCSGGDQIGGDFAESCVVYREEDDVSLETNVEAELQFELAVNGQLQGERSWGGEINGLGAAEIEGAFKGAFNLEADLKASFASSRTWAQHTKLDVLYDPSSTQIQWWRVAHPRLRYLEIAEFDACGRRTSSNEIFLSDLRDSRLVLGCEEVPSFDSVCHGVEPTADAVAACNELLIDPASPEGQQCLGM